MTWKSFFIACLLSLGLPLTVASTAQANSFIITDVSGTVESRWRFSFFWNRVTEYTELDSQYRLRVGDRASVTISCLDINGNWISRTTNTRGEVAVYEFCADRVLPSRATAPTRSPIDETLPYIISPRNTALLPENRSVTWNSVSNAVKYRVSIRGRGFSWESDWLTGTESQLPSTLEAGRTYEISVETDHGESSNPGNLASPTFTILAEEEVNTVTQKVAQVEALELDSTAQALVTTQLYREHNLNQNALSLLSNQIQSGQQSAAIYQLQASLYAQIGLIRQAQQQYINALALTDAIAPEQSANIQEQLGRLARRVVDHAEAVRWLQSAESIYRQQLDTSLTEVQSRLQEIQALIADSQSRLPPPEQTQHSIDP